MNSAVGHSLATRLTTAGAIFFLACQASAQDDPSRPPQFDPRRYIEDYSYLDWPSARQGRWWEPFKRLPLADDVKLGVGGELRATLKRYVNNRWGGGAAPDDTYLWYRALPYADLDLRGLRLFGALTAAYESGVALGAGPTDKTAVDVVQGFAEFAGAVWGGRATVRGGRQLLLYGSGRLVSPRYGPNVGQPFDGLLAIYKSAGWQADALVARPVEVGTRSFDDKQSNDELVWLLYTTFSAPSFSPKAGVDAFYIGYRNERATFDQGRGRERRHTFGARVFGSRQGWSWNAEGFWQFGGFGRGDIRAWSLASETSYTWRTAPLSPTLSFKANAASGDHNPSDPELGTFNPLFPKGEYFGELVLVGPRNLLNVQPAIEVRLAEHWKLSTQAAAYWRQSARDGIYGNGGELVRSAGTSQARFIGSQAEALLTWMPSRECETKFGAALFRPGRFIRETGDARTTQLFTIETVFRF